MVPEIKIPLTEATIGEPYCLENFEGGRGLQRRLAELGLTPGVSLRVLQDCGGPLLIAIRNSRIALGRGMANKITVSPIKDTQS